jgi:hypothetical protein
MDNNWHKGYQEVKNVIHNDIGVTKEEILEVFRQVAKDEIKEIVCENQVFIWDTLREVIRQEMINAVATHRYPKVNGHMWMYGHNGKGENSFKDYIAGVMKEEIVKQMEEQFEVNINVERKED